MRSKRKSNSVSADARVGSRPPSPALTPAEKRARTIAKKKADAAARGTQQDGVSSRASATQGKADSEPPQGTRRGQAPHSEVQVRAPPRGKKGVEDHQSFEGALEHAERVDGSAERVDGSAAEGAATGPSGPVTVGGEEDDEGPQSPRPALLSRAGGRVEEGVRLEAMEVWVEGSDDDAATRRSKMHRKFNAGVPQWDGGEGASELSARARELEALADAADDFDFNSIPRRAEATTRPSAPRSTAPKDSAAAARKQRKGAGVVLPGIRRSKSPSAAASTQSEGRAEKRGRAAPTVWVLGDDEVGLWPTRSERAREGSARNATSAVHASSNWPSWTNLKRVSGTRMALGDQTPEVKEVIQTAAADEVPYTLCFENAYPDEERRVELLRDGLIRTAEKQNKKDIAARLEKDEYYVKMMVKIPEARVSNYRKKFKDGAVDTVQYMYRLEKIPEEKYVQRLQKMLDPAARLYVFPGKFDVSNYGIYMVDYMLGTDSDALHGVLAQIAKMEVNTTRPFCHPAIINLIHKVCFGPRAIPRFPRSYYVAIAKNKDKPELPRPMVALAATAIEAGLTSFTLAPEVASKVDFNGDVFGKVYEFHHRRLRHLKKKKPHAYSALMSELYELALKGRDRKLRKDADSDASSSGSESDTDDLIDVDEFERAFGQEATL
ncbi:hypothetical protein FA95DRAFT_1574837 [Auriscalpium vulgare]|uniref:Uncharacterized protein n=1 Tax=Auriscalpium vulgare TaxID=40419 RepID=A0ACB8RJM0_9AGAM|nr:hypothetical protein FA95DRAFT_1574837 [Auriscalpium vulgare]